MAAAEGDVGAILRLACSVQPRSSLPLQAAAAEQQPTHKGPESPDLLVAAIRRQTSPWSIRPHDCLPLLDDLPHATASFAGSAAADASLVRGPNGWLSVHRDTVMNIHDQTSAEQMPQFMAEEGAWVHCTAPSGRLLSATVVEGVLRVCSFSSRNGNHTLAEEKLASTAPLGSSAIALSCAGDGAVQLLLLQGTEQHVHQWQLFEEEEGVQLLSAGSWTLESPQQGVSPGQSQGAVLLQALALGFSLVLLQVPGRTAGLRVSRQPLENPACADCMLAEQLKPAIQDVLNAATGSAAATIGAVGVDWKSGSLQLALRHSRHSTAVINIQFKPSPVFKRCLLPAAAPTSPPEVRGVCALLAAAAQHCQLALEHGSVDLRNLDAHHSFGLASSQSFGTTQSSGAAIASNALSATTSPAATVQALSPGSAALAVPDNELDSRKSILAAGKEFNGGQRGYNGPPWALMGCEVSVLWAGQQWFQGTVTRFDPGSGRHFVQYRDGDERWYSISEKTFRVLSVPSLSTEESARLRRVADTALEAALVMAKAQSSGTQQGDSTTQSSDNALLVWSGGAHVRLLEQSAAVARSALCEAASPTVQACVDEANAAMVGSQQASTIHIGVWEPLALDLRPGSGAAEAARRVASAACAALRSTGVGEAQPKDQAGAFNWICSLSTEAKQAVLAQACSVLACHGAAATPQESPSPGVGATGRAETAASAGDDKITSSDDTTSALLEGLHELQGILEGGTQGLFDTALLDAQSGAFRDSAMKFAALATTNDQAHRIAAFNVACMLASMPEASAELSLRWLRLSAVMGYHFADRAREDDDFDSLRKHVAFEAVLDFMERLRQGRAAAGLPDSLRFSLQSSEHVLAWAPAIPSDSAWETRSSDPVVYQVDNWQQELEVCVLLAVHVCSGCASPLADPSVLLPQQTAVPDSETAPFVDQHVVSSRFKFMMDAVMLLEQQSAGSGAAAELASLFLLDLHAELQRAQEDGDDDSASSSHQESILLGVAFYLLKCAPEAAPVVLPQVLSLQCGDDETAAGLLAKSNASKSLLQSLWTELLGSTLGISSAPTVQHDGLEQKSPELGSAAHQGGRGGHVLAGLLQQLQSRLLTVPDMSMQYVVPLVSRNAQWLSDCVWYVGLVVQLVDASDTLAALRNEAVANLLVQTLRFYNSEVLPVAAGLVSAAFSRCTSPVTQVLGQLVEPLLSKAAEGSSAATVCAEAARCIAHTMKLSRGSASLPLGVPGVPAQAIPPVLRGCSLLAPNKRQLHAAFSGLTRDLTGATTTNDLAASRFAKRILQPLAARGVRAPLLPGSMARVHNVAFAGALCAVAHSSIPKAVQTSMHLQELLSSSTDDERVAQLLGTPEAVAATVPAVKAALEAAAWAVSGWKAGRVLHELALWIFGLEHVAVDTPFEAVMQFAATEELDGSRLQAFCTLLFNDTSPADMPDELLEAVSSCGKAALRSFFGVSVAQQATSAAHGLVTALLEPAAHDPPASTASQAQIEARVSFAVRCISCTLDHWVWTVNQAATFNPRTACPAELFVCMQLLDRCEALTQLGPKDAAGFQPAELHSFLCSTAVPAWQAALFGAPCGVSAPEHLLQAAAAQSAANRQLESELNLCEKLAQSVSRSLSNPEAEVHSGPSPTRVLSAVLWQGVSCLARVEADERDDALRVTSFQLLRTLAKLSAESLGAHQADTAETASLATHLLCAAVPQLLHKSMPEEDLQRQLDEVRHVQGWLIERAAALPAAQGRPTVFWRPASVPASGQALLQHAMTAALEAETAILQILSEQLPSNAVQHSAQSVCCMLDTVVHSAEKAAPVTAGRELYVEYKEEESDSGIAESKQHDEAEAAPAGSGGPRELSAEVSASWRAAECLLFRRLCSALLCEHAVLATGDKFESACNSLEPQAREALLKLCSRTASLLGSGSFQLPSAPWARRSQPSDQTVMCGAHPLLTPRVVQALLLFATSVWRSFAALPSAGIGQVESAAQLLKCAEMCTEEHSAHDGYSTSVPCSAVGAALHALRALCQSIAADTTVAVDCGPFAGMSSAAMHDGQMHSPVWPLVSLRVSDLGQQRPDFASIAVPVLDQASEQLCQEVVSAFGTPQSKDSGAANTPSELRRRLVAASAGASATGRASAMREALLELMGGQAAGGAAGGVSGGSEPNASEALNHVMNMYSTLWGQELRGYSVPLLQTASGGVTVGAQLCVALSCAGTQSSSRAQGLTAATVKPTLTPSIVWEASNHTGRSQLVSLEMATADSRRRCFHAVLRSGERRCVAVLEVDTTSAGGKPAVLQRHGLASVHLLSSLAVAQEMVCGDAPAVATAWRAVALDEATADSAALANVLDGVQGVELDFNSVLEPGKVGVAMSEAQALAAVTSSPLLPGRVPQRTPAQRVRLAIDTELRRVLLEKLRGTFGPQAGIASAPSRSSGQEALAQMLGLGQGGAGDESGGDVSGFLRNVPASLSGILGAIAHGSRPPPARQPPSRPAPAPSAPSPPAQGSPAAASSAADVFEELALDSFALDGESLVAESPAGSSDAAVQAAKRADIVDHFIPGGNKRDPLHVLKLLLPADFERSRSNLKQFVDLAWTAVRRSDFPSETLDALRSSLMRQLEEGSSAIVARGALSLCTSAAHHLAAAGVQVQLAPLPVQGTPKEALSLNGQDSPSSMLVVVPGLHQGPAAPILANLSSDAVVQLAAGCRGVQCLVLEAFCGTASAAQRNAAAMCLGGRLSVLGPLEVGQVARVLPFELDTSAPPPLRLSDGRVTWAETDIYHKVWVQPHQLGSTSTAPPSPPAPLDGALVRVVARCSPWSDDAAVVQVISWGLRDGSSPAPPVRVLEVAHERLAAVSSHAALSVQRISGAISGKLLAGRLIHAGSIDVYGGQDDLPRVLSAALQELQQASSAATSVLSCACVLMTQLSMAVAHGDSTARVAIAWAAEHQAELVMALSPLLAGQAAPWASSVPALSGQVPAALAAVSAWNETAVLAGLAPAAPSALTPCKDLNTTSSPGPVDTALLGELPSDVDRSSLFCSFAIQAPEDKANVEAPQWGSTARFSSAVRFAGFKTGAADPRRGGKGGFRASEQVVFPANKAWPCSAQWAQLRFAYFEATIVHSERSSGQSSPAVRVGLWSDTSLGRGTGHGCEWGPGSVVYCGESGRVGRWRYSMVPSLAETSASPPPSSRLTASPAASPAAAFAAKAPLMGEKPPLQQGSICLDIGSLVEVQDTQGQVVWRPARVVDARAGERLVHFHGWQSDYNEWLDVNSARIAANGTHTSGCTVAGFVEEVAYGPVWGTRGDTVGCLWDRATGSVAFTRNGKYLGIAATGVWGMFAPAVSSENQAAGITMNFGGVPFAWSAAPSPTDALKVDGQAVPAAHRAALAAIPEELAQVAGTEMLQRHSRAHAQRVEGATQAAAVVNARTKKPNQPRPHPYPNWEVRNMARDLKEMLPPEASEAMVMRVLRLCGNDRGQAAEHLLQHMEQLMASSSQAASMEAADREQVAGFSFVELRYTSSGRTDRYVDHNVAGFGGSPPNAPGMTGKVVLAHPEYAQRALENADEIAGNIVMVRRGECTFVQKLERAQAAGATAMLLVNTQGSSMFVPDSGTDDTSGLHIPLALLSFEDGEDILANRADSAVEVNLRIGLSAPPAAAASGVGGSEAQDGKSDVSVSEAETKCEDDGPDSLGPAPRSQQAHSQGYSTQQGQVAVLGATHSSAAVHSTNPANESNTLRLPWSAAADAVVGTSQGSDGAAVPTMRDSMGKLVPSASAHGGGLAADGLVVGDRQGGGSTPSVQVSAQEQWISGVERSMSLRRVPAGVIAMVLDLLRQGGENQIAIARSMLEDVNIVLPPAPDADAPSASGNAGASPAMRAAASPFSGPSPPSLLRGRSSTGNVDSPGLPPMASSLQRSASSAGGSRVFNPAPPTGWVPEASPRVFLPGQMVFVAISREDVQLMRSQLVLKAANQLAAPPGSAISSMPQTPGTPLRPLLHLPPFLEVQFQPAGGDASVFVHGTIERHVPPADSGLEHVYDVVSDAGDAEANVSIDRLQVRDAKDRQLWVPARKLLGVPPSKATAPTREVAPPSALTASTLRAAVTSLSSASLLLTPPNAVAMEAAHSAWAVSHDRLCAAQGRVLQADTARGAVQVGFTADGCGHLLLRWFPSSHLTLCHQPVVTEALLHIKQLCSRSAAEAARRESLRTAAAQLQLALLRDFSAGQCEWGSRLMPTASSALFASAGWAPRSLAVPEPSTPLGSCTPALLTAVLRQPALIADMLSHTQSSFAAGAHRGLVLGGDRARALTVKACTSPIAGWHVALSVHTLTQSGSVSAAPLGGGLLAAAAKAIPEGTVLSYRGVRSEQAQADTSEGNDSGSSATALHAVGRAADAVAFMANEAHWVASHKTGNSALRSLGLPGGGTSGPRAHDAVAGALSDLAAPVVLRCSSFDVEAVTSSGAAATGASSLGVVATATPLPTDLPLLLALCHALGQLLEQDSSGLVVSLAQDTVPGLLAAAADVTTPSDVAAAMLDAATRLIAALPAEQQARLGQSAVWPALQGIVADICGSEDCPHNSAGAVRLPLGASSTAELTAAAVESVKRGGSAGASTLYQAAARCASMLEPLTAAAAAAPSGLAACAYACEALSWLASGEQNGKAPPAWLLKAAWGGPAWNALWRSLPDDTFPAPAQTGGAGAAAAALGEVEDAASDDGEASPPALATGGTQKRRVQVYGPSVAAQSTPAVDLNDANALKAYAACGPWSSTTDKALVAWASQLAAAAARAAAEGSQAAGDAAQMGLQLSVSAFTARSGAPDALSNISPAEIYARYSLLARISSLAVACAPLLCPDGTHPSARGGGSTMYALERDLSTALPRLMGSVFNRWALHCVASTAAATTSVRPRIKLNRFSAGDPSAGMHSAIWAQTVRGLRWTMPHSMQLRQVRTAPHLTFEARLQGERVAGESGPYREVLDDCGRELAAHSAGGNLGFGMFQGTPNATGAYGEFRDCVMPSAMALQPASSNAGMWVQGAARASPLQPAEYFVGLGQLLAAAARSSAQVGVPLAPAAWQSVFGHLPSEQSLASVHAYLAENSLRHLRECGDEATFEALFGDDLPSSTALFEMGRSCEVLLVRRGVDGGFGSVGGVSAVVSAAAAPAFASWLADTHTASMQLVCAGLRRGFASVFPLSAAAWLTQSSAAVLVAGAPDIDVDLLQRNTQYSGGATASSMHIQQFWRVLRHEFTPDQRQKFIKFAWGQSRLPADDAAFASNGTRLLIKSPATPASDSSVDGRLPTADTCFFNVTLPPYSCYEAVRRQLTLVVSIGAGLDADAV